MSAVVAAETRILSTAAEVAAEVADLFVATAEEAVRERGTFFVALAGGTTFVEAYRILAREPRGGDGGRSASGAPDRDGAAVDWGKTHVFFGDERCVPEGDPDRNDRAAREALLDHVPIPSENVHAVDALRGNGEALYEAELMHVFRCGAGNFPRFDLLLLGLGPDGHTASLFPGHAALNIASQLVARIAGSPKPPSERITFTLPLINAARLVAFAATGESKRMAVAGALHGDAEVPAALVRPENGRLLWILDSAAASGVAG